MKSFSLLRTNVGLTTNVKIVCDSSYNLYLESIDSVPELSSDRFKKFMFNKNNFFDELVPYFFKDFPSDIAYSIKFNNDESNMSVDFSTQYDDIYQMGARNISDNKNYSEEYEYFAPLYVFKQHIPKYFVIFRVDGPGLEVLSKDNFRADFLEKFKTVKVFDLTKNTAIGEWIDRCFKSNKSFPTSSLEVDFRNLEFSRWTGIDYNSGGFTYKSRFLEESIEDENTLFDFEKLFFDGYKENKIIHPQIINFNFLFDDTPATPTSLRKWSLNRYSGFYIDDMNLVDCITPFILPELKSDIEVLEGNILNSASGDPFVLGYKDDVNMWIEYLGEFYKVEKFTETSTNVLSVTTSKNVAIKTIDSYSNKSEIIKTSGSETIKNDEYTTVDTVKYRIISEINLEGKESLLNKKIAYINSNNQIINIDQSVYSIDSFNDADINLIEIDGIFHNLILKDGFITINSDYGFNFKSEYRFEYFINSPDPNYYKFIDLAITNQNSPKCFRIYKLKFTDIKDFDTQIIDNEFSKFEYEKSSDLSTTEEPKMYTTDLRSVSTPASFNDYIYKEDVVLVPAASDYTANLETFRIFDNNLSEIWRKNSTHCRFGFQNSISTGDYPYLLNNNDIHENFNRCADVNSLVPERRLRNLDYFYSINSGTTSYIHHSLHIEKNIQNIQDSSFRFELDKYLNQYTFSIGTLSTTYSSDYFSYLFSSTQSFFNGEIIKNVKKFSYFDTGDSDIPNTTLFKGLKFRLFEVDSITKNDFSIENINLQASNKFEDYKFSILLSQNLQGVDANGDIYNTMDWGYFIDVENNSGFLSFKTSNTATPSNIEIGDVVEIKQNYPIWSQDYNGISNVTSIGLLPSGGYGFTTNKPFGTTASYAISGYFKVNIQWKIVKIWELDTDYKIGDLVIYNDIIYTVLVDNNIDNPLVNPSNISFYQFYNQKQPIWNPDSNITYNPGDWVYRQGEYYVRNNVNSGIDFWDETSSNIFVLWKGRYYKRIANSNFKPKEKKRQDELSENFEKFWKEVPNPKDWYAYDNEDINTSNDESLWDQIPVWSDDEYYIIGDYIVHNDILWRCIADTELGDEPSKISSFWERIYSFVPDTNLIYTPTNNPIIQIGDNYYVCTFNSGATLDSGITIYINKKWKNVLVNIAINDNTTQNIDNSERDLLYSDINSRLTAANFIRQINDLDSKYDFSDYTSYVIIEENGSVKKYNYDNISNLPYLLLCEGPDEFELRNNSLVYNIINVSNKDLKAQRFLVNGKIDNLAKLNFYNDIPLAYEITKNENTQTFGINYNGRRNVTVSDKASTLPKSSSNITETYYRHSGNYMPIFYDIELFKSAAEYDTNYGNYKFDENLTFFGLIKQRIISKVNRKENILKLRNSEDLKSIYPMLDEFGYLSVDSFIFKSTWDYEYHIECIRPVVVKTPKDIIINKLLVTQNIIQSKQ